MRPAAALALAAALLAGAPGVASAVEVSREVVIDAAPGRVWQIMGPFCSIAEWHPVIARCEEESVGGEPHRRLTTRDGGVLLERLTASDVDAMSYAYEIVESPLPVQGYRSTIGVTDTGDGKARLTWRSSFEPRGATEAEAAAVIGSIYDAGLASVKAKVAP
jgi:uncharacterized protein YndB with AHSA1/START domain